MIKKLLKAYYYCLKTKKPVSLMQIVILRYGHRDIRDYRVTSHCALVARAFGAEKIIIEGNPDEQIKKQFLE